MKFPVGANPKCSNDLGIVLRIQLVASDVPVIRTIVEATRMFSVAETAIAVELASECLARGSDSGYHFIFAEFDGGVAGYACFGPVPCTISSWDLYWIAVHPTHHRRGIGRVLVENVEMLVREYGGTQVYVDTSGREAYVPTRAFYERMGYERAAVLPDFYAKGDAKVVYAKSL